MNVQSVGEDVRAECIRIARRIHLGAIQIIGFIPTGDDIAVPPVVIQLGLGLAELTGSTIAVIDANVRWPGLARWVEEGALDDGAAFRTTWLHDSLALLTPRGSAHVGEVVPGLERLLVAGRELFAHMLVDLTSFDLLGEHTGAAACMDQVVLLARAGHSRERHLVMYAEAVPAGRLMGVLLAG